MILNYQEKRLYLYRRQKARCPICDRLMHNHDKLDFDHRFHNTEWARKKYPVFLNSIFNFHLTHHECNINKRRNNHIARLKAQKWEVFLNNPIHWKCKAFGERLEWPKSII